MNLRLINSLMIFRKQYHLKRQTIPTDDRITLGQSLATRLWHVLHTPVNKWMLSHSTLGMPLTLPQTSKNHTSPLTNPLNLRKQMDVSEHHCSRNMATLAMFFTQSKSNYHRILHGSSIFLNHIVYPLVFSLPTAAFLMHLSKQL